MGIRKNVVDLITYMKNILTGRIKATIYFRNVSVSLEANGDLKIKGLYEDKEEPKGSFTMYNCVVNTVEPKEESNAE